MRIAAGDCPSEDRPKRRLLLLSYSFPPDPAPGSARAWRFYKYLPEFGYETSVITSATPRPELPRVRSVPVPPRDLGEKLLRKFLFPYDEAIKWTLPALHAAREIMAETPVDVVLSTFPYVTDHLVAMELKREFGIPWVADYRDPLVGNPFRVDPGLPHWVDDFLDTQFFTHADLLLAVTDRIRQGWIERHPETEAKSGVIWNGFDPDEPIGPKPLPERPYRVVSHFGSFYGSRTPVPLLESALRLIERGSLSPHQFRFRFVGSLDPQILAARPELFEHLVVAGCLELRPIVPRPLALEQMMHSDSLMLADINHAHMGHTVPAKLFEYIRVGRPILALTPAHSAVEQVLNGSGVSFVRLSEDMTPQEFDANLLQFLQLPTEPQALSPQFMSNFNGRNQAHTLAGMIDRVLGQSPNADQSAAEPAGNRFEEAQR